MERVRIYDSNSIDHLPWPDTPDGMYAKRYLIPFIKHGPHHYINNVQATMLALTIDNIVLPITISNGHSTNSHVHSLHSHYIGVASEKIKKIRSQFISKSGSFLLKGLESLFHIGKMNYYVSVNNWLLPTNLHTEINSEQVGIITNTLTSLYPNHAIIFRGAHEEHLHPARTLFQENQYLLTAHRQIFITNTQKEYPYQSRMFKSDLKLLRLTDYEIIDENKLSCDDIPRILALYQALYREKHSSFSPDLNHHFFDLAIKNKLLYIKALKKDGRIDAVVGYYHRQGVMTSPVFGYDTERPQKEGLYRMISTLLILEAKDNKMWLNHSAGAGSFKKLRRAAEMIEYMAVYCDHLPFSRKIPWIILNVVMNKIGIPLMKRYQL